MGPDAAAANAASHSGASLAQQMFARADVQVRDACLDRDELHEYLLMVGRVVSWASVLRSQADAVACAAELGVPSRSMDCADTGAVRAVTMCMYGDAVAFLFE